MSSGYEIRYSLLNDAKKMLYEKWTSDVEIIRFNAVVSNKTIDEIPAPPSAEDIKALAQTLYEFVQQK
jgi:hypothetical protein